MTHVTSLLTSRQWRQNGRR